MPVITQKFIFRSDLRANPDVLYLFGDNYRRVGLGGQAKEMRGEPNAVGIATKWEPTMEPSAFFSDAEFGQVVKILQKDFKRAFKHFDAKNSSGIIVIPEDGLGTGLSQLPDRAPRIYQFLEDTLNLLRKTAQQVSPRF